ncbi:nitronate monooxygenase family protein [Sinimarinibacterium sp. NLF-5-8]|uniref:NAD(P)H-dependent flavin oxidoreductase n=1 Tax=Sinimarinibacterium sp. NLF-5-8 TaxID=2698684 RepID=UPI00137B9DB7|nr:nitronate monooxygenase [Sinimarinibacterium sp. NLF-5-8]QHS10789.1 nitronate monooxygenase [Sinimarinibacterium sp. NLF-5-8]
MNNWFETLGLRVPVVQAGMGGGLSTAPLAGAVSKAGGLGTLGILPPDEFAADMQRTRALAEGAPFAVNLLMPFVRPAHVAACIEQRPAVAVLFYGHDRDLVHALRAADIQVWHQIGSAGAAQQAIADGADAVIAQGVEAGGHLAGDVPLAQLLPQVRAVSKSRPVLAAGGIFDAASSRRARALGADGVVAGTRFLLTDESNAHDEYKARLLSASTTLRTQLFGLGWPAWHRVAPNAATQKWCAASGEEPLWLRALNTLSIPSRRVIPLSAVVSMASQQRLGLPFYTAASKTKDMPEANIETTALYAGECVSHIESLQSAADVVAELARGFME